MSEMMRAGLFRGPGKVEFGQLEKPSLIPGDAFDVLIRVKAAGVCGSDLHIFKGEFPGFVKEGTAMCHELTGEIVEIGEDVTNVKVGDRVAVEPLIGCGECEFCRSSDYHLCRSLRHIGYYFNGGNAEYAKAPHQNLYRIPDNVGYDEASLLDCYAVAVHGLHRVRVSADDTLVIYGAGPLGLCMAQVAQAQGAKNVVIIDINDDILDVAKKAGVQHRFNSLKTDVTSEIMKMTNGLGADIVIDAIGGEAPVLDAGLKLTRSAGTFAILGIRQELHIKEYYAGAWSREINIVPIMSYARWDYRAEFEIALSMIASEKFDASALITHRFPLEEIAAAYHAALYKKESKAVKVLIKP